MSPKVTQYNEQKALSIESDKIRLFVIEILEFFKITTDEIIIHFIDKEKISFLHGLYFSDSSTTDCISFPIDGNSEKKPETTHIIGECFINPEEALGYAPQAPYQELSRYIVHCILHFIGYKDQTSLEKAKIREMEDSALSHAKSKKIFLSN